ncbi:glycosyltransferase family 4 protein [Candidatus Daviesbacteria bacterium]|nr:glycosyltransferase family 4 protein [Candidatus Daviesbacteria bacterium]
MLIGFDGSRAFIKDRTGTENYSYQLLLNLAKIDTENQYLVYIRPGFEIKENWPKNFKFKVINYQRLWTQLGLSRQTFIDPLNLLFIPAHTLPIFRKPSLKTVITVHDLGAEYLPQFHQLKQKLYLKWMTHQQLKSATRIIAVSNSTKNDLINKVRLDERKIDVVYEGVDRNIFKILKKDVLVNILKSFDIEFQKYFLFVGTIQPRKNLDQLILSFSEFIKDFPDFKLVIAGSKGWMADEIYKLPNSLGIEDKVKFLGRVSDEELVGLYNGGAALTFISLFEGFGLPILEAFACSCPVLVSSNSSLPEITENAGLVVNLNKKEDILNAMKQIIKESQRQRLIRLGSKRLSEFSWEKTAKQTRAVFEKSIL